MNVTTLTITPQQAAEKLAAYRQLTDSQRTLVDDQLLRLYRMVQKGQRVINVDKAFQQTGLNEQGQPKLAMARADWAQCHFTPDWTGGIFTKRRRWDDRTRTNRYIVPRGTWDQRQLTSSSLYAPVPHIPPHIRPTIALSNYWILFEVQRWETYPVDPFLLRHVYGSLYVIEAEWELTPLEAELLSALSA